ncbi:hypothetical protein FXO38_33994 [Capsicum annuum]|uniref:Uncharacterized protein n=1 Tax=Capsicum annuum TaxID=4072 RepID=A0A2G2YTP3_CAPAN|nr:hypothetical protein FXO38_33994 [Capsicum annuum]PHT73103.1 hypothetical protein T459_23888 [Capsicum annuum]
MLEILIDHLTTVAIWKMDRAQGLYFPDAKWDTSPGLTPSLENKQEIGCLVEYSARENLSDLVDENFEYSPTALILHFLYLGSISPIADLNIVFSQNDRARVDCAKSFEDIDFECFSKKDNDNDIEVPSTENDVQVTEASQVKASRKRNVLLRCKMS